MTHTDKFIEDGDWLSLAIMIHEFMDMELTQYILDQVYWYNRQGDE